MDMGIASVAAITIICYLIGMAFKLIPSINNDAIPVVCGVFGALIGYAWFFFGFPDYPASDPVTAIAVGIVSGLAATGVNQAAKKIKGGD